ncbi:MAG: class I SAM-dependent methyltransferase [Candidatus Hodarchaeota archaeon]
MKKEFSWKKQIYHLLKNPFYLANLLGHEQTFLFRVFENYLPKFILFFKTMRRILFKGKNKICPCCGGNFKKFIPVGTQFRLSAQCPGCSSLERHRLMLLYLKTKTDFFKSKLKVLYFAPNKILLSIFKNLSNIECITADLSSPLAMIKTDITDLIFEDKSFDVILCSHVLEHVINDTLAMREIFRVLKPNGWAIIQSPIDYSLKKTVEGTKEMAANERRKLFGEQNHFRIYGIDYKDKLERAGFKVQVDNFVGDLNKKFIDLFGLDKREKIYICFR